MTLRLLETISNNATGRVAAIYRDVDWREWVVRFAVHGVDRGEGTVYHTDDKGDAQRTARAWAWAAVPESAAAQREAMRYLRDVVAAQDDEPADAPTCPTCGHADHANNLGTLWRTAHHRCRACGMQWADIRGLGWPVRS